MAGEGTNGAVNEGAIAETLQEEVTVGYKPVMPLESLWLAGSDMPQITLRRDLEFMQMHPLVITGLEYYKSGISGAEFWGGPDHKNPDNERGKPISPDERVSEFVLAHVERFWQRGVPLLQDGAYPYGWAPGEHIYKEVGGMLTWSHLKDFHPNDAYILTLAYQPIGVRIKNIRGREPVDMWLASDRVPAKACWYPHRPRFNQFYGRSQLIGAWRPWRRLGWRDGVEQVIDAAMYRAGYKGPTVRYPPGFSAPTSRGGVPATKADGQGLLRRENRDVARQIGEYSKAGATHTLSSEVYPGTNVPKWGVEWPEHVMDVKPLIEGAKYLEDQILLGMCVPPELIRAGGTGSGYSGRSVPREAFLDQQQRVADAMLQMFVEQVLRPLVLWNFGDVPFEVSCKSLLQSQADDKQGQDHQQGGQPPPTTGQPPGAPAQNSADSLDPSMAQLLPGGGSPMSFGVELDPTYYPPNSSDLWSRPSDESKRERVLAIVRRILSKCAT